MTVFFYRVCFPDICPKKTKGVKGTQGSYQWLSEMSARWADWRPSSCWKSQPWLVLWSPRERSRWVAARALKEREERQWQQISEHQWNWGLADWALSVLVLPALLVGGQGYFPLPSPVLQPRERGHRRNTESVTMAPMTAVWVLDTVLWSAKGEPALDICPVQEPQGQIPDVTATGWCIF
jgi:hypothetical protein